MKSKSKFIFTVTSALILMIVFATLASAAVTPVIPETKYESENTIVADAVLTDSPYYADNTGIADCTEILQRAIDDCFSRGGGTVFLPDGKYRLTGNVYIKPFVSVVGDHGDPDEGNDYGTLIIAGVESIDAANPALFTLGGSGGAVGLTVWYPDQTIDNVKPYPFTFYVDGAGPNITMQTVKDCTMLNSYRGIGVCAEWTLGRGECHGLTTLENVKGTVLYRGLECYNAADVDTYESISFNGKYWSEAGEEFNAPSAERLNAYTKENAMGLMLGDLEWVELCNIKLDSFKNAVEFVVGPRCGFNGTFFDVEIKNCVNGFYANENAMGLKRTQWGYTVVNATVRADKYAFYDPNPNILMLINVKTKGLLWGKGIHRELASTGKYSIDYLRSHYKPENILYVVDADTTGRTDASASINSTLQDAALTGGIVYLPAGVYRLEAQLRVPDGVELHGASHTAVREQPGLPLGTILLSYCAYLDEAPDTEALIRLGKNSGLSGVRVMFVHNSPKDNSGYYRPTAPAVKLTGDGGYVNNCLLITASKGIVAENCKDIFIKKIVGCCYEALFELNGCSDVQIEGNLQNATAMVGEYEYGLLDIPELSDWLDPFETFDRVFIPITRKKTELIVTNNCKGVTILNTFVFGAHCFLKSENSEVVAINVGSDGSAVDEYRYCISGGEVTVMNNMYALPDHAHSLLEHKTTNGGKLRIYGRQSFNVYYVQYTVLENLKLCDIEAEDFFTFIFQPLRRVYEVFGKFYTNMQEN